MSGDIITSEGSNYDVVHSSDCVWQPRLPLSFRHLLGANGNLSLNGSNGEAVAMLLIQRSVLVVIAI
jgi:hypothetical protein